MTQLPIDLPGLDESIGAVEERCRERGHRFILGLDEVGRGPLAGPVTVGGVLLDLDAVGWCDGIDDSKKLSPASRESWCDVIAQHCIASAVVHVHVEEIDVLNVLGASLEGMRRVATLLFRSAGCDLVLVDGNRAVPGLGRAQHTIVKGDSRSYAIAAASVLAKVERDRWMQEADGRYRGYGFARHKGYPTKQHREALLSRGPCEIHRRSFRPVAEAEALHLKRD